MDETGMPLDHKANCSKRYENSAHPSSVKLQSLLVSMLLVLYTTYQDDLTSTGKLLTEWIQCTNKACKKWMDCQLFP